MNKLVDSSFFEQPNSTLGLLVGRVYFDLLPAGIPVGEAFLCNDGGFELGFINPCARGNFRFKPDCPIGPISSEVYDGDGHCIGHIISRTSDILFTLFDPVERAQSIFFRCL